MSTDTESKYRYFAGFVYKHDKDGNEQITQDELYERLLRSFGDFAISPMHAPDEEQQDEHWHVVYKHPSSVRLEPARNFMIGIEGVPFFNDYIIPLHHPANYQRYLIHLDSPEKEQFAGGANAITTVNNFPLNLSRELSLSDKLQIQKEIESFATEYNIFERTEHLIDVDILASELDSRSTIGQIYFVGNAVPAVHFPLSRFRDRYAHQISTSKFHDLILSD